MTSESNDKEIFKRLHPISADFNIPINGGSIIESLRDTKMIENDSNTEVAESVLTLKRELAI